jgi:hypothetical protein
MLSKNLLTTIYKDTKAKIIFIKTAIILLNIVFFTYSSYSTKAFILDSDFSNLTLKATCSSLEYMHYEPILLNISLNNETSEDVMGGSSIKFDRSLIRLVVTDENHISKEISNLSPERSSGFISRSIIKTGQKFESDEILFNLHTVASKFGKYKLQFFVRDIKTEEEIKSESIEINIIEPIGENKRAYKAVKNIVQKNQFFFAGVFSKTKQLEDVANNHQDTLYGDYAAYFVASRYYFDKDYYKAEMYLNRSMKNERIVFQKDMIKLKTNIDSALK